MLVKLTSHHRMSFQDLDINESWPKSSNDMMQYVICNKHSLFAPRLKTLKKQGFFFEMLLKWKTLMHFYMELRCSWTILQCNLNWIKLNSNSRIGLAYWKQMECKLVDKVFKILLWIRCWKKNFKKINLKKHLFMLLHLKMG
jgi:hypothetical protein